MRTYWAKPLHGRWREISWYEYEAAQSLEQLLLLPADNPGIDLGEDIGGCISFNFTLAVYILDKNNS